jgi:hypothetical protein
MRSVGDTHRITLRLTDEGYRRLLASSDGIGKGPFVDVAINHSIERGLDPFVDHRPTRPLNVFVTTEWTENPVVLSARLERVLRELRPIPTSGPKQEMIFYIPHQTVIDHLKWSLGERSFPHSALGNTLEMVLRRIDERLQRMVPKVESLSAPVDPELFRRVRSRASMFNLDFDTLLAYSLMEFIDTKQRSG